MKWHLLAIGKARGPCRDLVENYRKRLRAPLAVHELSASTKTAENALLLEHCPPKALKILLDPRGKDEPSEAFALRLQGWQESGAAHLVFMIGGAEGFLEETRQQADFLLNLGQKTWPHMLARVLLLEQLYRAQQINAGHPYHKI